MTQNSFPAEDPILTWSAPQQTKVERGLIWYIVAGICTIGMVVYSVATAAWTFTGLIVLVGAGYWWIHKQSIGEKTVRIWKRGFAVDDEFIEWNKCKGYWILKLNDYAQLHIEKVKGGEVKILTGDLNPYQIHEVLSPLLSELEDRREHILDTIIRICKL